MNVFELSKQIVGLGITFVENKINFNSTERIEDVWCYASSIVKDYIKDHHYLICRNGEYLMADIPNPSWSASIRLALQFTEEEIAERQKYFSEYTEIEVIDLYKGL